MIDLTQLTHTELIRQKDTINLIASENYPSPEVMQLMGSCWMWKYGEGYPGKRYYAGNTNTDTLEKYTQQLALKTFDSTDEYEVNVQMLSGSPANGLVYLSMLNPGDMVMSMGLADGGHLSHLHKTSAWGKFFRHCNYQVKQGTEGYEIDTADFAAKLAEHQPKLVIIGFSAYPSCYQFDNLITMAHQAGALVMADIAHIAGLVAVGRHATPFQPGAKGADIITMTTHKTLRGPRGGLIFAKKEYMEVINKTAFPGSLGGPHFHQIAAYARMFEEILGIHDYPDKIPFSQYIDLVLANAQALQKGLLEKGCKVTAKTGTHLVLISLPLETDSLKLQQYLEEKGIITNRNAIPGDVKSAWRPSGLRLGTAAMTSRGWREEQFYTLGCQLGEYINKGTEFNIKQFVSKWYY